MNANTKFLTMFMIFVLVGGVFVMRVYSSDDKKQQVASIEERQQFKKDLAAIDTYHDYLDRGDLYAKNGKITEAEREYFKALKMAETPDGEIVARGKLARFYESIGENEKALREVEWFLNRNLAEPGRVRYLEAKARLLKKIG